MSAVHSILHQLVQPNAAFLGAFLGASIAFVAIVLVVERFASRVASAHRHLFVITALLAPVVLFIGGMMDIPASRAQGDTNVVATISVADAAKASEWICALAVIWLAGVVIAVFRTIVDALRWRSIAAHAEDRGGFALSGEICEPMAAGIVAPRILLPAHNYIDSLSEDELESVFAHEREHIARRDNLIALVTQLATSVFWFDPIHRLARRRAVELRERACDEAVLARGCAPRSYLTALAKSCRGALHAPAVSCMSRVRFQQRMETIMNFDRNRLLPLSSSVVRLSAIALVAVAVVAFALIAPPSSFALESNSNSASKYKRIGEKVKAPVVINRVNPLYPAEARKNRTQGIVILEVKVSATGAVDDVQLVKGLPDGLNDAAIAAVNQWTFKPGTVDGKPVPVLFNLTIQFKLDKDKDDDA